jgi:hypothetical protein
MKTVSPILAFVLVMTFIVSLPAQPPPENQRGPGKGRGPGMGRGPGPGGFGPGRGAGRGGRGHQHDARHDADREVFQFLLKHHDKIERTVKNLPDGVETLTESNDPEVAAHIKEHVEWMEYRIKNTHPIRMRDPLFAELFRHTDKIKMIHEDTEKGVRVIETSDDPKVARLIQAHAQVVSKFVKHGFAEAMKNHPVPTDPRAPRQPVKKNQKPAE